MIIISHFPVITIRNGIQKLGTNQLELGSLLGQAFFYCYSWVALDQWEDQKPQGRSRAGGVMSEALI